MTNPCRYLFNDAEVKPFDSAQLASECFGGEMTVRLRPLFCLFSQFSLTLICVSDQNLRLGH